MHKRFDRILNQLSKLLMIGFIQGADQWMLLRWPLLWRSRLLPLLWYVFITSIFCLGLGMKVDMDTATVWTNSQVDNATSYFQILGLIAAIFWFRLTLRYPVSELDNLRFLRVGIYYVFGIASLLLPAQALYTGITYRVSKVISDEQFYVDLQFHKEHGFWCCTEDFDKNKLFAVQNHLENSLRRFGLSTDGFISPNGTMRYEDKDYKFCIDRPSPCLKILDAEQRLRPGLLRERLESIALSKKAWRDGLKGFVHDSINRLHIQFIWLLIGGVMLSAISTPEWQRERWLGKRGRKREWEYRLWLPGLIRRVDSRLLRNAPMLWATRIHVFLFHSLTIGLAAGALILVAVKLTGESLVSLIEIVGGLIGGEKDISTTLTIYIFLGLISISPILWAFSSRRYHIPAFSTRQWKRLAGTFFLAAMPLPLLFLTAGAVFQVIFTTGGNKDIIFSLDWALLAVSPVVAGKILYNYTTPRMTLLATAVGVPLIFTSMVVVLVLNMDRKSIWAICIYAFPLAAWIIGVLILSLQKRVTQLVESRCGLYIAAILIGMIPAAALSASFSGEEVIKLIFKDIDSDLLNFILFYVTMIIGFTWGLSQCLTVIVSDCNRPQVE